MNHLSGSHSPYLLQHVHNPVNWYPWNEDVLRLARKENKLMVISIGYAACHWCHVMEKESFEDTAVAALMNEHYICIKVDREERPDIDKFYMDAVTIMTQHGGWPLNCITLPDGRPIYGGTYFPKNRWISILQKIATLYQERPDYALEYAEKLTEAIAQISKIEVTDEIFRIEKEDFNAVFQTLLLHADLQWGGNESGGNKFPLPSQQRFLLEAAYYTNHAPLKEWLHTTLKNMALGGIYDALGGGFARYATDPYWRVPHFEKMLYDNAQLIGLYALAHQDTPNPLFKKVVYETIQFVQKQLTSPEFGFYSSLDADIEGEEGMYYVWTKQEILSVITEGVPDEGKRQAAIGIFLTHFHIKDNGNWEHGKNVLYSSESEADFLSIFGEDTEIYRDYFNQFKENLLRVRTQRTAPGLDNKILASSNGLMLKALCEASFVFQEPEWLSLALQNANYLWKQFTNTSPTTEHEAGINVYRNAQRTISGFLDDYALLANGYLSLYGVTFDPQWVAKAGMLIHAAIIHFYDEKSGMFFFTKDEDEWVRKYEISDDVIPSSNAIMADNLMKYFQLTGDTQYRTMYEKMLANMKDNMLQNPYWNSAWLGLALKNLYPQYEVVLSGNNALETLNKAAAFYLPDCLFAGGNDTEVLPILRGKISNHSKIYVCRNGACGLPVTLWEDALEQIKRK